MAKRFTGTTRGFAPTSKLLQGRIRKASESRGFEQRRVLTHWAEVAGERIAAIARPVEISYARGGMGATLVLLTTGPNAPMLEMEKTRIQERVNACYGYRAIARIRITQTAPTGFAEGQVAFGHAPREAAQAPDPAAGEKARALAQGVAHTELRLALEALGANVLTRQMKSGSGESA